MAARVKPGGPCPSVPLIRACTWIRPILVRNVRAVSSVPMIRANPVSGWCGLASQKLSLEFVT